MDKALDIARYIINHENNKHRSITNLRLQKLLYFCQGAVITKTNGELCFEEDIEAWTYGPVVPCVYKEFCSYYFFDIPSEGNAITPKYKEVIDSTLDEAARMSTSTLVDISHCQTPWAKTYSEGKKKVIEKSLLIDYFKKKANR